MSQKFNEIIDFIQINNIKEIGIFLHQNADPDALGSAIGLKDLIRYFLPKRSVKIYASSLNKITDKIRKEFSIDIHNQINNFVELIILCDTNNPIQLGELTINSLLKKEIPIMIIDHHSSHKFIEKIEISIIQEISSTAEIIGDLFFQYGIVPSSDTSTLLLAGIIFDSRRFLFSTPKTFEVAHYLMNFGNYEKALSLMVIPTNFSERVATIKGIQRVLIHKKEEELIAISHISSYESSVARTLIRIGADLALVISVQKHENRISIRCKKNYAIKHNLNLGHLANEIAEEYGGSGGGHLTAAGMNLSKDNFPSDVEQMKKKFLKLLVEKIY